MENYFCFMNSIKIHGHNVLTIGYYTYASVTTSMQCIPEYFECHAGATIDTAGNHVIHNNYHVDKMSTIYGHFRRA